MTDGIREQLILFCMSAYTGALMALAYDFIRIIRNVKKFRTIWIWIQDITYWVCFGYVFYHLLLNYNFGGVRAYAYLSVVLGMALYFFTVSRCFVKYTSLFLTKIVNTLLKILKLLCKPIKLLGKKLNEKIGKKMREWHKEHKAKGQRRKEERQHRKEERRRDVSAAEAVREERMTTEL